MGMATHWGSHVHVHLSPPWIYHEGNYATSFVWCSRSSISTTFIDALHPPHFHFLQCRYGEGVILTDCPQESLVALHFIHVGDMIVDLVALLFNRAQCGGFPETWKFCQDCAFTQVRRSWFVCSLHHWSETGMLALSDTFWVVWGWCYMHMILCW